MEKQFAEIGILYVDDEEKSLKYFEAIFEDLATIYTASSPEEGYAVFCENHDKIGLVLSDNKMPNESGLSFLSRVREFDPAPLRFLVTAFADLDSAVDSLNDGLLYSYLSKPWDPEDLEHRIIKALGHFSLMQERTRLVREKAEAFDQLMMADKAASIGILSTGLNHHMRNALTVIRTFHDLLPIQLSEELEGDPVDTSFWKDYYEEVGGQIGRMTSMLNNLAEGTSGGMVTFDDEVNVEEVIRASETIILNERPDIGVSVIAHEPIPVLKGNSQRISQMLRMLFDEVAANLPDGGNVEVGISTLEKGETVQVEVLDDGHLIPKEELSRLFDPFYVRSDRPEDLGTNLMACYLTVFYHGGNIRAEHSDDGRNRIVFTLPKIANSREAEGLSRETLNQISAAEASSLPGLPS